jgi:hypothetical protein
MSPAMEPRLHIDKGEKPTTVAVRYLVGSVVSSAHDGWRVRALL